MKKKFNALKCAVIAGAVAIAGVASCAVGILAGSDGSDGVAIDETNFPDSNFRSFVSGVYDKNEDGKLNPSEIENATIMNCDGYDLSVSEKYTDLTGIQYFVNLDSLNCSNNKIQILNVSGLTKLKNIAFSGNPMTSLNVRGCTGLIELRPNWSYGCGYLEHLDASGCTSLEELDCWGNPLTSLDVSGCTSLKNLISCDETLTSLDVNGCTSLEKLYCYGTALTSLDVSGCTSLENLDCFGNDALTSLDVSGCTSLKNLNCCDNALTSLDVSGCTSLENLGCRNNALTTLNVSNCKNLTYLDYSYCLISEDVSVPEGCAVYNSLNLKNIYGDVDNGVTITWRSSEYDDDGYSVLRKSGSGDYVEIGKVDSSITSYTDKTVEAGYTYTYTVSDGSCWNDFGLTIVIRPGDNAPFIENGDGKIGWEVITGELNSADAGAEVTVDMNGADKVSGDVIDSIKGKDVTVVLDLGEGISWSVNGDTVTSDNTADIDMSVELDADKIPADVVNTVGTDKKTTQLSLGHDGNFGFDAVLSIPMDKEDAGQYANLFYYNEETGKLEFMEAVKITDDGEASFTFKHASDYVIVIDKTDLSKVNEDNKPSESAGESKPSETTEANKPDESTGSGSSSGTAGSSSSGSSGNNSAVNNDIPATGDTVSVMWLVVIGAVLAIVVTGVHFTQRKKADEE